MHGILSMPSIVTILRTNGYPTPLQDEELRSVRILVAGVNAGHGLPPRPVETLEAGQEVIVAEGAFAGMRGLLLEGQGRVRVVVRLSVLQAVSVQLPRRLLRSVPQDSRVSVADS